MTLTNDRWRKILVWMLGCGIPFAALCVTAEAGNKPNIIFIMVDDAGVGDFTSYAANSPVKTPNIDALAANGMKFTNAYAPANVCGPSRASLLTGLHQGHASIRGNFNTAGIFDKETTIGEVLKSAGYATGGYGKWGVGSPGTTGAPERQGFDEFVGYYHQVHAHSHYPDRLYDSGNTLLIPENSNFSEPETGLVANTRKHAHSVIFDRMTSFIDTNAQANQPFFAYGAWTPPHRKSTLPVSEADPGGFYEQYASEPGWDDFDKIQAGFVSWIDDQVGQVVQQVNDLGIADDTLIIFTSDHGGWQSSLNHDRNTETVNGQDIALRGNKGSNNEGGLRVPFIASWANHIQPGSESDLLTYFPDMMATFAELGEAQAGMPPSTDGISIVPTLTGVGTQTARDAIYFESPSSNPLASFAQAVRMDNWKATRSSSGTVQLYDLSIDPTESNNVAGANPAVVAQITAFMDASHEQMRPQFNVNPPNVGTGNASKDGIIALGIRPGLPTLNRNWSLDESGDAQLLSGAIQDQNGLAVEMYLNDLEPDYEVSISVERTGGSSPELSVELLGDSGTIYFEGAYDTGEQAPGSTEDVTIDLGLRPATPGASTLAGDLGEGLTLRISHGGGLGQVLIGDIVFASGPLLGDLNFNGAIDTADWVIFRGDLFSDLSGLTLEEAYRRGDLNTDGLNNELDFEIFKEIYDATHGAGSLQQLVSGVPEPATLWLLGSSGAVLLLRRSWRR
ncbi:MAG: sulfatase-like hydrolase/transferase [Aeoliella sp.]